MARIRKSPSHLLRVGTIYHFRYSIPQHYRQFASGEVRVSLGTGSLKAARIKAAWLTTHTQGFFKMITEGHSAITRKNEIKEALGQYLRELLEKHEIGRLDRSSETSKSNSPAMDLDSETMLTIVELDIVDQLKGRPGSGKLDVSRFFNQIGLKDIPEGSPTYKFVHRELLKLCQAVIKIEQERMKGSPIVQIRERDKWIGWHTDTFMDFVSESPSIELGVWLYKTVDRALSELFLDDFIEDQLITPADLRTPSTDVLKRLTTYGDEQRELHHRLARSQDLKRYAKRDDDGSTARHWKERSKSHLYRSKRAFSLADMLRSRMVLQEHLSSPPTIDEIRSLIRNPDGRRIFKKVLRKAKADRVGIAMADITVCGAVAPYNPILGGKLVSMIAASPEVIAALRMLTFLFTANSGIQLPNSFILSWFIFI